MTDHFDSKEWQKFKSGMFAESKKDIMENHLSDCDECREIFLSLISSREIEKAERMLSPDFTETVMDLTQKNQQRNIVRKNSLVFYAAAAAVTLVMMGSGVFQFFVDSVTPKGDLLLNRKIIREEAVNLNISGRMVDKAASWIKDFETQETRGGMKNE